MSGDEQLYDVMVIGAGFAGMAASLFAADRGLKVVQTGATGGIDFSTGFIDLMGVHPIHEGRRWVNPWEAIQAMTADIPNHPYALLSADEIRTALETFTGFLAEQGIVYKGFDDHNVGVLTPAGTIKQTYRVPLTAWKGTQALEQRAPTLIVDFTGLKGFSGEQLVQARSKDWPALRAVRVAFPGGRGELYPEHMAWALSDPKVREQLAATIAEHCADVDYIGFPAVLGLHAPLAVIAHLEELTGKHIFEIPTLPPSIAGPRLRAVFDRGFPNKGVRTLTQKMVSKVERLEDGTFVCEVGAGVATTSVRSRNIILATGRFFGKGLAASRTTITESVFNIPVVQPESRSQWRREQFFDAQGHPVNMAGIEVDAQLRPLAESGQHLYENLFAAGIILAHHDWMRMKCGAGIAIATAYKAVQQLM